MEEVEDNQEVKDKETEEVKEDTGYRQQTGRVTCIICAVTRNTKSQMRKHMEKHEEEGDVVPVGQVHCGLVAFPECPFQCSTKEELMKHIDRSHKKAKVQLLQ